jgi:uncharacterized protein involved in exopolysaccharide biosynthesis
MDLDNLNNKDMHVMDYLNILKRQKWIFISFFLITVTAITLTTFMQKKVYRATATIIVDAESPNILSVKDVVKLGESDYLAYRDYIDTQKEIVRSRRITHQVIKNLELDQEKKFKEAADPVELFLKKLQVELVRDTRILKISIDDEDPKKASLIANEFAKVYAYSNIALKMKMSSEAQDWLRDEVEKEKQKVTEAEFKLQGYKEVNDIVSIENQKDIMEDALVRLNTSYLESQKKRINAETIYKSLVDEKGNVLLENLPSLLTDNKSLEQLKQEYLAQEAVLSGYRQVYKNKHPKMIKVLGDIDYLKSRIRQEIESEYTTALEAEKKFKTTFDDQRRQALELERKTINYNSLKRELETSERILEIVLNRLKETSISGQIQANNVHVQDLAETPRKPIKPNKRLNVALAAILGIVGGTVLAFFREYMDVTLKDPAEIAELAKVVLLGSVPCIKVDGRNLKRKPDIYRVVEKDSD